MIEKKFEIGQLKILGTEVITPELAEKYLLHNKINRKIKRKTVDTYAMDMASGKWGFNDDGRVIAFDKNFNLINGQNRLSAIVKSGVSIEMFIAQLDKESNALNENYDSGVVRSPSDFLGLSTNTSAVLSFFCSANYKYHAPQRASKPNLKKFYESLSGDEKEMLFTITGKHKFNFSCAAHSAFFWTYIKAKEKEDFLVDLVRAINSGDCENPLANRIRTYMMANKDFSTSVYKFRKFYYVLSALEGFMPGKKSQDEEYQKQVIQEIDKWLEGRF